MNFKILLKKIEQEKKQLENIINISNKEVEFFDAIISNNTFSNLQGLLSLDSLNIMIAYLCAISNQLDFEEIYDFVKKNSAFIDPNFSEMRLAIFQFFNASQKITNHKSIKKMKTKSIEFIIQKLNIDGFDLESARKLYNSYGNDFIQITTLITCINKIKKDYISKLYDFEDFKNSECRGLRISSKKKNTVVKEILEDSYNLEQIYEDLSIISSYYETIRSEDRNKKKRARKLISNYVTLINFINSFTTKQLLDKTYIQNMLKLIDNEDIAKEFLYQLHIGQKKYFEQLHDEYSTLSQDNKINIQSILNKYEIDFDKLSVDLKNKVLKFKKEELDEFLHSIKELRITSFELICFLLKNSNCEVIKSFIHLMKDGAMTLEFILENKDFFSINNDTPNNYFSLLKKIQLLKTEGIHYRLFIQDLDVYLVDYKKLLYNINVLKQYNLLFGLNKMNSFELLKGENLESKIDLFLELGYEKILEENIYLLNIDPIKVKKLYILKNMKLLPMDIEGLMNVIENKNFLDYIEDVDSYIFNIVNYRMDMNLLASKELDFSKYFLFNNNNRTIEINGVYLSKNRIQRNILKLENTQLSDQDKIIYSIIYGSILTEEEYNTIISNLSTIHKKVYTC